MRGINPVYFSGLIMSVGSSLVLILSIIKLKGILNLLFIRYTFYMACATIASIELGCVAVILHSNLLSMCCLFCTQVMGYLWLVWAYIRRFKATENVLMLRGTAYVLVAISTFETLFFGLSYLINPNASNMLIVDPVESESIPTFLPISYLFLGYIVYCAATFLVKMNNVKSFSETKRSKFQRVWFSMLVSISFVYYSLTTFIWVGYLITNSGSTVKTLSAIRDNSIGFTALIAFIATSLVDHKVYTAYIKINKGQIARSRKQMAWFYKKVVEVFPTGYQSSFVVGESEEEQLGNEVDWIGDTRITLYRTEAWHKALELGLPVESIVLPSKVARNLDVELWTYYLSSPLAASEAKEYSERLSPILTPELDDDVEKLAKYQIKVGKSVKRLLAKKRVHNRPKIGFRIKTEIKEGLNDSVQNKGIVTIDENELVYITTGDTTDGLQ